MIRKAIQIAVLSLIAALGAQAQTCDQPAPPTLCVDPLSWNVIGLDSNKAVPPTNDGPDTFMVGARACNTGSTTLINVTATYNTVGAVNPYIALADNSTISIAELRPGRCEDFYFNGQISRVNAAYFTTQQYTVTITSGALTAVTPANRELYIEKLNSQNRNTVLSVAGPTALQVGGIYTFTVNWSTAPGGYEQLEHFLNLANTNFRLLSSYSTYDTPTGSVNSSIYADACGWDNDRLSPTYRSCIGPQDFAGGKAGGSLVTYFTVQILGATPLAGSRLRALIYDFSGSSYHYNTDFNSGTQGLVVNAAAAADLGVTISDSPDPVLPGGALTYTGVVTNAGLSPVTTADGGALKIPIPPGTTFASATMPGWTCALAAGVVTCSPNATFASGASASYTLNVTVSPTTSAGTLIPASASISSSHEDPTPANNVATTTTLVASATQADLFITNTVPAVVVQGSAFSFTQTVTNSGPASAANPTFVTQVPAGSTFSSITTPSSGWTCSAPVSGAITCTRSTPLAVGESAAFSLNLVASGAPATALTSQAYVQTTTAEPYTANNVATATTNIIAANTADVAITVVDSPDPVVPGESILYTQTVRNNGVIPAQNVTVSFPTPPNTVYSYIDFPAGWSCSTWPLPGSPTPGSAGTITCTKATLAVGETASFPLTVSVGASTAIGTIINYTATVSSTTADSIPANNTASVSTLVGAATAADVEVVKTPSADPIRTADSLVYNLRVTNNGPATATNVVATDPLPSNLTFVAAVSSRGGACAYNAGTRTVSCPVGTLTNGQTALITVRTTVDAAASGQTLTNTATVAATQADPRMANNSSAAPVTVVSATAVSMLTSEAIDGAKSVQLHWTTSYERNNLGFNVYRESGSSRLKVNRSLIAGSTFTTSAPAPAGFSYHWTDRARVAGAVYWIESVDLNGTRTLHGPVVPHAGGLASERSASGRTISSTSISDSMTLADLTTSPGSHFQAMAAQDFEIATTASGASDRAAARQFELAAGAAAKIRIDREGLYRISRAELAAAGFDPGSDPKALSLYVDGEELPISVNDGGDGRWDPADDLEFYGFGLDSTYSGTRVYWLVRGSGGLRFKPKGKVKGAVATADSFLHTVELKERFIFFAAQSNAADRDSFYGPVVYSDPTVQTFDALNLASTGTVQLSIAIQGATLDAHRVAVRLNGASIGQVEFDGQALGQKTFTLPSASLRPGRNEITLVATAGWMDISFLDVIRVTYPHTFAADGSALRFPASGGSERTVTGFPSADVRVIDVTNPREPAEVETRVSGNGGSFAVSATPFEKGARVLYATTRAASTAPVSISSNRTSTLASRQNSADFVIVSHGRFIDALAPLVAQRRAQNIETMIVDVDDVYDEFGYGSKSADAIREFLRYTQREWKKAPRHAMLVGDASFDPRNYIGYGDFDLVPTRFVPTVYMKAASDDWLADFDGDRVPDIYMGRLSVRTEDEARAVVDKIVGYAPAPAPRAVMVVDADDPTYSFNTAAVGVRHSIPTGWGVASFEIASHPDRSLLLDALRSSPSIVNYIGHGSIEGWSNTAIFTNADVESLQESGSTPFFVTMSCLNGYFADPDVTSLAEALLRVPNGGAIAVWASSAMADPQPQAAANQAFYRILATDPNVTLGELVARAKAATPDADFRITWTLIGDPTLRLR